MIYSITDWPAVSLVCSIPVTWDTVRSNPSLLSSLHRKKTSNVSRVETAEHRLRTDRTASPVILVLLLSKWSCKTRSKQKTTSSEESSCVRAAGPLLLCDGASTDSASPLGVGNVCKEKCEEPVLSLAAPIWEPHPNTNAGAKLVFQASELDLSLISFSLLESFKAKSDSSIPGRAEHQVSGWGNTEVWEEGKVGMEPFSFTL